jgi:hypothetical protein
VEVQLHAFLDFGTRWRWVVSFAPRLDTPRDRALGTHWIAVWVGPRAVLDAVVKRKIPSPRRESNPRTPIVQPVAQRYTDWGITDLWYFFSVILNMDSWKILISKLRKWAPKFLVTFLLNDGNDWTKMKVQFHHMTNRIKENITATLKPLHFPFPIHVSTGWRNTQHAEQAVPLYYVTKRIVLNHFCTILTIVY